MFKLDAELREQLLAEEALAARLEGLDQSNISALPFGAARVRRLKELRNVQALLLQPSGGTGGAPPVRLGVTGKEKDVATSDGPDEAA